MAEYIDFFNVYILGSIEMLFQFYFFTKILKKKTSLLFYFLFAVCAAAFIYSIPVGTLIGFAVFVILFTAGGTLICHADFRSSLLYAALVDLIMQLSYGSVNSLFSILNPLMPARFHDTNGIAFMLTSETVSLILAGICYYMVYRYFSSYTAAEIQYMFLVFIPILMLFLMREYINTIVYDWKFIEKDGSVEYLCCWNGFIPSGVGRSKATCGIIRGNI